MRELLLAITGDGGRISREADRESRTDRRGAVYRDRPMVILDDFSAGHQPKTVASFLRCQTRIEELVFDGRVNS